MKTWNRRLMGLGGLVGILIVAAGVALAPVIGVLHI